MAADDQDPQYEVRGLIVDVGYVPDQATIRKIIRQLRKDVPEFAELVGPRHGAELIGSGATDIFIPVRRSATSTVQRAWAAVHILSEHDLVADAEPAIQFAVQPSPESRARARSGGSDRHLPGSASADWSILQSQIKAAWTKFGATGEGVIVGHPDLGYTDHPEVVSSRLLISLGYNFEDDAEDPRDPMQSGAGHGSATASVIISDTKNSPRVFGVAPAAKLIPLRVSNSVVHFDFSNLVKALYWAREKKCDIVSMSLGGPWAGRSLERAVDHVVGDGLILLAAAGNQWPWVVYPAKLDNVVAVAACNANRKPWKGSARGSSVDITAPGESVWRAKSDIDDTPPFSVDRSSGTSYAVATVAGACALWLSHHGATKLRATYQGRLAAVFLSLLKGSAARIPGWDTNNYGPGLLDAQKLLALPLPALGAAPLRAAARPQRTLGLRALDALRPYFPELSSEQLARASEALLGKGTGGTGRTAAASRKRASFTLMDEVAFHVATNPAVRQSFLDAAKPVSTRSHAATTKSVALTPPAILRRLASEPLRAEIAKS
ncbi:MAG: S8 family serine peptidase [Proteobacteria bacterium]|nr:S8 family serine peptidase [Pseudomonadota bacterium]